MTTFVAVDDAFLAGRIRDARDRVVLVTPAVSKDVAAALGEAFHKPAPVSVTVILDPDEEPYRLGYGQPAALAELHKLALDSHSAIRSQPGLRIGVLVADDTVLVWSPVAASVEQRLSGQPNGLDLSSIYEAALSLQDRASPLPGLFDASSLRKALSSVLGNAVGTDDSEVPIAAAEVGREPLTPALVAATKQSLEDNPPAPFDLARKTRVFSTRLQFVESERRGAALTQREIKLSRILLNADVPKELRDLLETRVRPYSDLADVAIEVPVLVQGQLAFDRSGQHIRQRMTESDLDREWRAIANHYLYKLDGFGWLIERSKKGAFERDVSDFEFVLGEWVKGFREVAANSDEAAISRLVDLILGRVARGDMQGRWRADQIREDVKAGMQRLRVTEPGVKVVFKDVAWESTRDAEFAAALEKALPHKLLEGWFETFTAARARTD